MVNMSAAISALRANQVALQVIGNNIANANNPNYHRQDVVMTDRPPIDMGRFQIGTGVEVTQITRAYDAATEMAIRDNITARSALDLELNIARQIESLLSPTNGSVIDRLDSFFNQLEEFTGDADSPAARSIVVRAASDLAESIRSLSTQLDEIIRGAESQLSDQLATINSKVEEIAALNLDIRKARAGGSEPNDLLDRRDAVLNELAAVVDVQLIEQLDEQGVPESTLVLADGQIYIKDKPVELGTLTDNEGNIFFCRKSGGKPFQITSGSLGATAQMRNSLVGEYQGQLEDFVQAVVEVVDTLHLRGIGLEGSFETLVGQRFVDPDIPLAQAETIVPVESGSVFVSVIAPDGTRELSEISVDPISESMRDVANKLAGIDHLSTVISDPPGQLSILAEPGYEFDFVTTQAYQVDGSTLSGTATPTMHGLYTGGENRTMQFTIVGSGTIGVTPGLKLAISNATGQQLDVFDIGEGYPPDRPIELPDGVAISLGLGSVADGETFSMSLIENPDTSKFLTALGMNTLFAGDSPHSLKVRDDIVANANLLATTRSGDPLDTQNAEKILNQRYAQVLNNGTATLAEHFSNVIGNIGADVLDLANKQETLESVAESLETARDGISGVDPNEEAIRMLQFQRAYQATARYIANIEDALDELFNILR